LPEPRKTVRLGDEKDDNQNTGDHEGQLIDSRRLDRQPDHWRQRPQRDRHQVHDRRAEEGADDRAEAADDDDEQDLERQVDGERLGLGGAEPKEHHEGAGDADDE